MKNGEIWQDVKGNDIQAHGGCIMQFEGKFHRYRNLLIIRIIVL